MRTERECAANQLRANDVYINGSRLSPEELVVLQGCRAHRPGSGLDSIGTTRCPASGGRYVTCGDLNFPLLTGNIY
jgi:hypothetical protein